LPSNVLVTKHFTAINKTMKNLLCQSCKLPFDFTQNPIFSLATCSYHTMEWWYGISTNKPL